MKGYLTTAACALLLVLSGFSQKGETLDLHKLMKTKGLEVFNREVTLIDEPSHKGIRLSKDEGEGVAWLSGVEFSNGTIEFDVRGENVMNHSFVGLAFHGKGNATFDAIDFRPFRFKDETEELRSHGIQYVSLPEFPWRTLREKWPNKFEHAVDPAPDPNSWIRIRIVVDGSKVTAGKTFTQISNQLFIARETTKTHVRNIYKKLEVNCRADAIAIANREHLI